MVWPFTRNIFHTRDNYILVNVITFCHTRSLLYLSINGNLISISKWKMRTHGKQKRRTWRKYHVSVDPTTHEVTALELTEANIHDCTALPALLSTQKDVGKLYADGAYSFKDGFDAITRSGGEPSIPVRSGTALTRKNPSPGQKLRDELLQEIWNACGRIAWKKVSEHHRRSLVETHMFRLKTILGARLRGRNFANQQAEAKIMANIPNKMAHLGIPVSEKSTWRNSRIAE